MLIDTHYFGIEMKFNLVYILLFCVYVLNSEENNLFAPDYQQIKVAVSDSNSIYFYPEIMKRFEIGDTTLNLEELRHLYYGYSFQDEYNPTKSYEEIDSIRTILDKPYLSNYDFEQVISFGEIALTKDPFNNELMSYLVHAYERTHKFDKKERTISKVFLIVDAILSSGNGSDFNAPYHVIYISHEYLILNILGYEYNGNQLIVEEYIDYLGVEDNTDGVQGIYFNMQQSYKFLSKIINKNNESEE